VAELLPELLEDEWSKFKFTDQQTDIEPLLDDPLIMISGLDEKTFGGKRIPTQLLYPTKEIELIAVRIRIFFSIRYMIFTLIQNDGQTNLRLKDNPMKRDEREIALWSIGNSYEVSTDIELVLCNVKINQKMSVRYVIIDQDFFFLVEPDFSKTGEYKVKVHIK